jgi:hypothetical protein
MQDLLRIKVLEALVEDGTVPENILRDELIRQEYFIRLKDEPEIKKGELRNELANKYNTSIKTVEIALYKSYERKRKINSNHVHIVSPD